MTILVSSPITGGAQTGLTTPTYTVVADTATETNGKQWAVTALGGTQTGVDAHSVARPFTLSCFRPKNLASLGKPNPTTGLIAQVPRNNYKLIVRKGVIPLAGQPSQNMIITVEVSVPAGADLADAANVRAALSATVGWLNQQSAGIGDTSVSGLLG